MPSKRKLKADANGNGLKCSIVIQETHPKKKVNK